MNFLFPHHATTQGVTVRVSVSYLPEQSEPRRGRWLWAYPVRIEHAGGPAVPLLPRPWIIPAGGRGARHSVEGEGVVGEQPLIEPGGSFDYVSGCPLATPTGAMQGSYRMVAEDGQTFDVDIPRFTLTAPAVAS